MACQWIIFFLFASLACIVRIASALAAGIRFVFIYQMIPRLGILRAIGSTTERSGVASHRQTKEMMSIAFGGIEERKKNEERRKKNCRKKKMLKSKLPINVNNF